MTTAARPTFDPARGGNQRGEKSLGVLSKQYSSRDLPAHLTLKERKTEIKVEDLKAQLEQRERKAELEKGRATITDDTPKLPPIVSPPNYEALAQLDADDDLGDGDFEEGDDLDEDDPRELLAELNKIKQERAAEEEKRKAGEKSREEQIRMENILSGNPLLNHNQQQNDSYRIKRRWDDDVVFKNCARGEPDAKKKPYVNDTLRQEFHKRFMEKYIH